MNDNQTIRTLHETAFPPLALRFTIELWPADSDEGTPERLACHLTADTDQMLADGDAARRLAPQAEPLARWLDAIGRAIDRETGKRPGIPTVAC